MTRILPILICALFVATCLAGCLEGDDNKMPEAVINSPVSSPDKTYFTNRSIEFSAVGSSDPDGDALSFDWDFGDGTTGTGIMAQKAYQHPGTYYITLKVSDGKTWITTGTEVLVRDLPNATIETSMGTFVVRLEHDLVPNTVINFNRYAGDGFYDGLIFHRVMAFTPDAYIIQGGGFDPDLKRKDPTYDGIRVETHPNLGHVRGAVAMANNGKENGTTSQFFICTGDMPQLDGSYSVFGAVVSGIDVVDSMAAVATHKEGDYENVPVNDIIILQVTVTGI